MVQYTTGIQWLSVGMHGSSLWGVGPHSGSLTAIHGIDSLTVVRCASEARV